MTAKILLSLFVLFSLSENLSASGDPVNLITGDVSYYEKYGIYPGEGADEDDRIRIHLLYVVNHLKAHAPEGMTGLQRVNRSKMIYLLERYIESGKFPKNYDHPGKRIPCFIDKDGNICAVGYLVAETAGYATAEEINEEFKYSYIYEINSPLLAEWVEQSGLTLKECEMIQPGYGYYYNSSASPEYIATSSVLGGVNIALTTLNTVELINHSDNNIVPIISGITGAAQIFSGIESLSEKNFDYVSSDEKLITTFNIAMGTSTVIIAVLNIIDKSKTRITGGANLRLTTIPITKDKSAYGVKFSMGL